jgi:tartrate-resistant acid phosphatase type 5
LRKRRLCDEPDGGDDAEENTIREPPTFPWGFCYYAFRKGPIAFFALDTNSVVLPEQLPFGSFNTPPAPADEQQAWLDAQLAASDAPWKIVYAVTGEAKGTRLEALFESSVCGKADVFVSGHDHDREWLEPTCGTTFLVSGAAAKLRDMPGRGTPSRWSDATTHDFLWVEVTGDTLVGVFYDEDGRESYEDTVTG